MWGCKSGAPPGRWCVSLHPSLQTSEAWGHCECCRSRLDCGWPFRCRHGRGGSRLQGWHGSRSGCATVPLASLGRSSWCHTGPSSPHPPSPPLSLEVTSRAELERRSNVSVNGNFLSVCCYCLNCTACKPNVWFKKTKEIINLTCFKLFKVKHFWCLEFVFFLDRATAPVIPLFLSYSVKGRKGKPS